MNKSEERKGYIFALAAYTAWGFFPLYWHLFTTVSAAEILCHRIIWSWLFYVLLLRFQKSINFFKSLAQISWKNRVYLMLAALFISTNWLIYIYAVISGHVLESSLGYFINPLVNVLLGAVVLRERLSRPRWLAVAFAFAGVSYMVYNSVAYIWIPLSLAISFGIYGLMRKTIKVSPLLGSAFETMVLIPFAVLYLIFFHSESARWMGFVGTDLNTVLLILGGLVTGLPMLWFTEAAVRVPYSAMGFLQYIAPTLQFFTAVLVFHENFGRTQIVTFALIWVGVGIFVVDLFRRTHHQESKETAS